HGPCGRVPADSQDSRQGQEPDQSRLENDARQDQRVRPLAQGSLTSPRAALLRRPGPDDLGQAPAIDRVLPPVAAFVEESPRRGEAPITLRQRIQEAFGSRWPAPATPGIGEAGPEAAVVAANE